VLSKDYPNQVPKVDLAGLSEYTQRSLQSLGHGLEGNEPLGNQEVHPQQNGRIL